MTCERKGGCGMGAEEEERGRLPIASFSPSTRSATRCAGDASMAQARQGRVASTWSGASIVPCGPRFQMDQSSRGNAIESQWHASSSMA